MNQFVKDNWPLFKTFWEGWKTFQQTGETPVAAYHAMRQLYCRTDGWLNDAFQLMYGLQRPCKPVTSFDGSLVKGFGERECRQAAESLERDGFYVFPVRIDQQYLDALMDFSFRAPAVLQTDQGGRVTSDVTFDPNNLVASNYRFPEKSVVQEPTIQRFLADPVLVRIAQQYIKSSMMFVNVQMWWTTPYGCHEPSSRLAQMFHFDMDRVKFMKYFLYLTDVGPDDGPHTYIRGSCKRKPKACLEDRRFSDAELAQHYPAEEFKEICGPRGTLLAVDTRGFHKAKVPVSGNRLILQLEMGNSLFGCQYENPQLEVKLPELKAAIARDPSVYQNYKISYAPSLQPREKVLV